MYADETNGRSLDYIRMRDRSLVAIRGQNTISEEALADFFFFLHLHIGYRLIA